MAFVATRSGRCLIAACLAAVVAMAAFAGCGEDELAGGASPVATQATAVSTMPMLTPSVPAPTIVPTNTATPIVTPEPTEPGQEPPPDPSKETPVPTPRPEDPLTRRIEFDYGEPASAQVLVERHELVVIAHVVEVLPAQWSTPDGTRPINPHQTTTRDVIIFTPVVVELDGDPIVGRVPEWVSRDGEALTLVLAAWGGQVPFEGGIDTLAVDAWESQLSVGDHVLVALSSDSGARPVLPDTPAGPAWWIGTKYLLQEDGTALTPSENGLISVPTDELIAEIERASEQLSPTPSTTPVSPASPAP